MKILTIHSVLASLRYRDSANPTPEEVALRQRFLTRYPNQEANIRSYQENASCRCTNDIADAIKTDPAGANAAISEIFQEEITVSIPKSLVGTTVVIDNTPIAYGALINEAKQRGDRYTGLSPMILPDGKLQILFW